MEILIAVGILAVALATFVSAQATGMRSVARAKLVTTATMLSQQKMEEFLLEIDTHVDKKKSFPDDEAKTGRFEEPYEDYQWLTSVRKVEIPFVGGEQTQGLNTTVLSYLKNITEKIGKSLREVKIVVSWAEDPLATRAAQNPEDEAENAAGQSQEVRLVTHLVNWDQR